MSLLKKLFRPWGTAACTANRLAGQMAHLSPATQIHEIISLIPAAISKLVTSPTHRP